MARVMTEAQEGALRFRLAMLCMAAVGKKDGDLTLATENVLNYVSELIEPYSTTGRPSSHSSGQRE